MLVELPFIQELIAEARLAVQVKTLHLLLETRFGSIPPTVSAGLEQAREEIKLDRLVKQAVLCPSLPAFEEALRQELLVPPSKLGRRRLLKTGSPDHSARAIVEAILGNQARSGPPFEQIPDR